MSANAQTDATRFHTLAQGTRVLTPNGPVRVEDLAEGAEVHTKDGRHEKLRRITRRRSIDAPVIFDQGAIGNTQDLIVAPWQRVLITGFQAEILYGQPEVLMAAADLVDTDVIRRGEAGEADYFELEFDTPETILAEGAAVVGSDPAPRTQTPAQRLPNVRSIFSGTVVQSFSTGNLATA